MGGLSRGVVATVQEGDAVRACLRIQQTFKWSRNGWTEWTPTVIDWWSTSSTLRRVGMEEAIQLLREACTLTVEVEMYLRSVFVRMDVKARSA